MKDSQAALKINAPRGTADTLPADSWKWQAVEAIAREVAGLYHYAEIRTPIYEFSEIFHRGVGETTDIIGKETFTFLDRGGESITLRPEGTAGVVRAVIENNLVAQEGSRQKLFYIGPNFRYERPQKGRLRQHHQFGVEAFGIAEAEQDVECVLLQLDFYRRCGLKDSALQINSLGDKESKQRFRDALVQFLTPKASQLSEESQRRLNENPLRILDSKDPRDIAACQGAPPAVESLSDASKEHFRRMQEMLKERAVPFAVNANLVRGFDYYTGTLWEITTTGLGSQNAIGGGGRYDNLVERLGGRPTPGVGFGIGLERLLIALEAQQVSLPDARKPLVWLVAMGESAKKAAWNLLADLRAAGITADMDLANRSMRAQLKIANREAAKIALILGDEELKMNQVGLLTLSSGEQIGYPREEIISHLSTL
jgi:histidyl-tRNA synthetase